MGEDPRDLVAVQQYCTDVAACPAVQLENIPFMVAQWAKLLPQHLNGKIATAVVDDLSGQGAGIDQQPACGAVRLQQYKLCFRDPAWFSGGEIHGAEVYRKRFLAACHNQLTQRGLMWGQQVKVALGEVNG